MAFASDADDVSLPGYDRISQIEHSVLEKYTAASGVPATFAVLPAIVELKILLCPR